eukprot:CAMPEP_0171192796 /NCGR_PEP_ID=MMETSP0790-20130122/20052_1 /TAXON_ID=2925 /ORGANISM="Alexandrium catenella, Strain OF101" /LENGTH=126 /DNA_ID=CAMNT_0011657961 /DNA_START=74 /DNA_END=455 /DNA_ORIENTATION=+
MRTTEFKVDLLGKDAVVGNVIQKLHMVHEGVSTVYLHVSSKRLEVKHQDKVPPQALLEVLQEYGKEHQKHVELITTYERGARRLLGEETAQNDLAQRRGASPVAPASAPALGTGTSRAARLPDRSA